MLMAELRRSTKARLAMRTMLGTVRNDLNRAMIARTNLFPNTEEEVRVDVSKIITAFA